MKQKRSKLLQFVWGNITMFLDYNGDRSKTVKIIKGNIKPNKITSPGC